MSNFPQSELAEKYLVDDLPGAARVGARLNGILQKIDRSEAVTALARTFLTENGLAALLALATDKIDREVFHEIAERERSERIRQIVNPDGFYCKQIIREIPKQKETTQQSA